MREIVEVRDAAAIFAVDRDQQVLMVKQSRPAIRKTGLEIPTGLIDAHESEEETVRRECEEETGYRPGQIRRMIRYAHSEGYSTGFITLFLGTGFDYTGRIRLDATEYLEPVMVPFEELVQLVRENRVNGLSVTGAGTRGFYGRIKKKIQDAGSKRQDSICPPDKGEPRLVF